MTLSQWIEVTAAEPCEVCGKSGWCSRNGTSLICRRESQHPSLGAGVEKQDSNGGTYWCWSESKPRTVSEPSCASYGECADVETLNRTYSGLLARLTLSLPHREALVARGLSGSQVDYGLEKLEYRTLPSSGRAAVVRELIESGHESDLTTVPGFVIRENQHGRYWTLAGRSGLLIPCRNLDGRIVGFQIRADGKQSSGKYVWLSSKKDGGPGPGAPVHVPLFDGDRSTIRLTEGLMKGDLATMAGGLLTIGLPGLHGGASVIEMLPTIGCQRVLLAFDADWSSNPHVRRAVRSLLLLLREHEVNVAVEVWDDHKGIDDVLLAGGSTRVVEFPEALELLSDPPRVRIAVGADEYRVTTEVCDALESDESLFERDGHLVTVRVADGAASPGITRPGGSARIMAAGEAWLRDRISRVVEFTKTTEDGAVEVHPPRWCIQAVMSQGSWPGFRQLAGVVRSPVLRPDGSVVTKSGFDAETGLYLAPAGPVESPPDNPTHDDAVAAVDRLLDVFSDFPLDMPQHSSALLAFILTPLARHLFDGPAPLFLVDANVRGSGKSLLCDLVGLIALGGEMPRMSNPRDDDECRKRITSLARAGDPLCLIDNISGSLGSPSLDAALTSTVWKDRILGASEIVELPLSVVWCATGNNVMLRADTSRRVLHIRLESGEESPETRTGFRYPDVRRHVREQRPQLLADALTVLSAFIRAGRPRQDLEPWGSFEAWSDLCRAAVVWVGLPDPSLTRQELTETADVEAASYRQLLDGWSEVDSDGTGLTAAELLRMLRDQPHRFETVRDAVLELAPTRNGELPNPRRLGNIFRKYRRRVCGGRFLDMDTGRGRQNFWRVRR